MCLLFPEVARRPCRDCRTYLYDDTRDRWADKPVTRGGKPVRRIPLVQLPPCGRCPKVPQGDPPRPESAVELSDRNVRAVLHYRRCKAVGRFPEDPIVERNAAIIAQVEDEAREDRMRAAGMAAMLTAAMARG